MATIIHCVNRIENYNLDQAKRQKEIDIVKQTIKSNKYETQTLNKICNKREKQEQDNRKKKWARFTYMRKETRYITGASHKGVNEVMPVVTALQRHVTAELCVSGRSAQ
jgi:uncharacterized protein (UPF0335 family)